ncbi:hypothetical protein F383_35774 [Gossypium arboreum]|uniref:Uncharacterized protein n=1 Tax=Gossypium arboreum TaxID=29729 RepID=A0A0B0PXP0_GOSAR|nr:hypothetical protein F383_35774 [Gossypium arboreum]
MCMNQFIYAYMLLKCNEYVMT